MCEMLAVASRERMQFTQIEPWAIELERLGIAGFGWGVAWLENGQVLRYRDTGSLRDDHDGRRRLAHVASHRFLVHMRRPSRLSTIDLADTQPFLQEQDTFAWCHNGIFDRHLEFRPVYEDRLEGKADSEVGFRLFESLVSQGHAPETALVKVHQLLGGRANLGYLGKEGDLLAYGGHPDNALWTCTAGEFEVATTALHSADLSVFDLVFPGATERRRIDSSVVHLGTRSADSTEFQDTLHRVPQ